MSGAERPIDEMERPTILVLAVPYVLATALAFNLRGRYKVVAPNLEAGETAPSMRWDAVLGVADVPIPKDISGLIIKLPSTSFHEPAMMTVDESTTPVQLTEARPIQDVVELLDHHLSSSA